MEKYSIKVNILNRPFPLLVGADEEEAVRAAARLINDKVKAYKERFSVKDDLDLVIMCCLELATDNINQNTLFRKQSQNTESAISKIFSRLNDVVLKIDE